MVALENADRLKDRADREQDGEEGDKIEDHVLVFLMVWLVSGTRNHRSRTESLGGLRRP